MAKMKALSHRWMILLVHCSCLAQFDGKCSPDSCDSNENSLATIGNAGVTKFFSLSSV